jgi:plastocyanin
MNETLFYTFGIALVVSAVVVSAIGLRVENFPQTRGILAGLIVYFAALVGGATWFAVQNAADDQHKREAEQAAAAAEQPANATTSTGATTQATTTSAGGGGGAVTTLKLSAPSDGTPAFDVTKLDAKAGPVTIDFDNPSPVEHDVAIAKGSQELAKSDLVTGGTTSVSTDLQPGTYAYYCTVPGHRETGMEGTLTVK